MFAIQLQSIPNLDPHGCDYAPTIDQAISIAKQYTEPTTIWKLSKSGNPIKWVNSSSFL